MQSHYTGIITVEPGKRGGKPCIRGFRITVYDVLEYLASGMTEAEILADFPDLTREDIRACLAFAADRERRMVSVPPGMKLPFDQNLSPNCCPPCLSPMQSFPAIAEFPIPHAEIEPAFACRCFHRLRHLLTLQPVYGYRQFVN